MKKFTRTGKKALSVFLAALMVMTAWVFVAPEAEAANGSYYYKVTFQVTDDMDNVQMKSTLYGKTNNGRGSEVTIATKDYTTNTPFEEGTMTLMEGWTDNGVFPTRFHIYDNNGAKYFMGRSLKGFWHVYVGSSSSSLTEVYLNGVKHSAKAEKMEVGSGVGAWWYWEVTNNYVWGNSNTFNIDYNVRGDYYPYVATNKSISTQTAVADIGIPLLGDKKDVSISTTKPQYYSTDQYGVRYEPTSYYLDTTNGVSGLSTSGGGNGTAYTITAGNGMTQSNSAIYRNGILKLNWTNSNYSGTEQQHSVSTYNFKVYNSRHKVTFNGNNGNLGTNYTYVYKNQAIGADSSTATSNNVSGLAAEKFPTTGLRTGYTFNGIWSAASGGTQYNANSKVTSDATWYAHWTPIKYNAVFKGTKGTYPQAPQEYTIATVPTDFSAKPTAPTSVEAYDDGDYRHTFNGNWKNSAGNVYASASLPIMTTAGATYMAQYNPSFVQADYSGVTAQQNEAARIKSNPNYEAIYTVSSRNNLQAALDAVVTGRGRTQQDVVDGYAQRIKDAIDALEGQKYSVVFMDGRDNSIIKFSYPNVFGDTIQYPANPAMSYDKNYHYTFNKWEGSAQETNLSTVEKNLTIIARFNKSAHSFTEEHINSNCVKQGGTKYTCRTCGYSYTEYSGSYGDHVWSTDWTVDTEATCTQPGSKSHHCTLCGATKDATAIPALGHDYTGVEAEIIVPVSCENIGVSIKECNRCGYNDYITVEKLSHDMVDEVTPPTCTSKGYTTSTCSNCGKMLIGSFTDPIAHNYVKKDSECVAPSCVGVGYNVSYCSVCGLKKYDIVPAVGHSWKSEQTIDIEPTCTTKGQKSNHCSVCDAINTDSIEEIPAKGHSYDSGEVLAEATCTQNGVKAYHCTVPGCGHTKTEPIAKLGHSWNTDFIIDVAATCKSAGVKSIHCSRCEAKEDITVIPQLSHNWNAGVENPKATCKADGVKTYTCASCNETKTEVVPKLGHNFVAGTPVDATCKSSGYIPYTCANGCGESYKVINGDSSTTHDWTFSTSKSGTTLTVTCKCKTCGTTHTQTIDVAEGHNYKNATVTKQPTCKETGTVTIACDKAHDAGCTSTVTATLPVNPNAHSKIKTTVTNPTCTAAGKVTTVCEACGTTVSSEQSIPAKGHSFSAAHTAYVAPTCKNEGSVTYTCTVSGCGATRTDTLPVNANAHNFKAGTTHQATCKTPAYTEYTCEYGCGTSYNSYSGTAVRAHDWKTEIEQNGTTLKITCTCQYADCTETHTDTKTVFAGHNYSIVEEVKKATCNAEGELKIKCSDAGCDASITVAVPKNANAHNYVHIYTAPTCQREGSVTDICSICNKELHETIVIAKLEHTWGEPAVTEPTCSKDGKRVYICTTCPDGTTKETKEEVIPKLGHDWKLESSQPADCTHGAYDHYVCRRTGCTEAYDVVKNGAKALGHNWGAWTITNPTNDKPGSATRTCANDPTHVETVEIPAGNHKFDTSKYTETTPATCTKKGSRTYTCVAHENCGVSITVETDLVQHKYDVGVRTEATCTEKAYITYTCTECGRIRVVFDESSTPLGHNYVHGESTATCEKAGTVEVTCSRCSIRTKVPAPALGHDFSVVQRTVPATCHSVGYVVKKCSRCEKTNTEYQNELVAHTWSDWTITAEPNEATGTNGTQERHCTNEGCTANEEAPIPAKIHNWVEAPELATEAICTAAATKTYFCSGCDLCKDEDKTKNATYTETVGVPLEHQVVVDYNAPTCTGDGSYVARCDLCGEEFVNKTLEKTGHSFNTYRDYVPATCVAEGSVTYACSNAGCGETQIQTLPVNSDAHKMVEDPENSEVATCTSAGYEAYKCANQGCEHRYMKQIESPKPHTEGTWTVVKKATCSSNGYEVLECADCHAIMKTREISATGSHTWETVTSTNTKPTCTEISYSYQKCSDCGKIDETSVVVQNATGHDFSVFVEKKDATATESGYVIYKCSHSGCAETLKSVIPASGHSFEAKVTKEATCTADGEKTYTCTVHPECSANYTEKIPALGHKAGNAEITPATCKAEGSVVVKCTVCEAELQKETLAKLPHTFNDTKKTVVPPTCKEKGSITYTCATEGCGATLVTTLDEVAHDYKLEKSVQPTCLDSGYDVYVCSVEGCDASYNKVTTSAKGHSAVEDTARHVEATCSAPGHKYFKCDSCGIDLYDYDVPATGMHNYSKTVKNAPTCESAGYTYTVCANADCGSIKTGSVKAIDALGHDYSVDKGNGVVKCSRCDSEITVEKTVTEEDGTIHALSGKITKLSTCKEQGEIEYICQTHENCPKSHTEPLPLAAHSANAESIEKTEPKCNADGTLTNGSIVVKCSVCGAQIGETITIPAAHSYKVVKVEKATCGSKGKVTERCETCGHERVTELEMNASAHEFKSVPSIKVDATCATDGYVVYDCKFCDAQKFVKTTDKLGHRHTETTTKDATCTEEGYTRVTCKDCGAIISETPIEKLDHTAHVVRVEPTCTAEGTITTKCSVCGKLLEDIVYIPENGHSWGEWTVITAGTCMIEGQRQRVCSVCGEKETISSGVGEHVYPEKGVVTPATCTTDGFTTYTCTVCKKHSIIKDYTPKLGHIYSADYKIVIEPTCHSTGAKAHYCARCGAYEPDHIQKYVEIPRLAHTYGEWVVVTEPTCDTNGVRVRTCTGCEEKDEGHTQTELIGKIGHNYGEWEITKKSTCVEEGSQRRYCDRCKTWEVQALPKGGHNRVADYAVEATCTAPGKTAGSHCSLCGLVFVAQQEVPMKEHMDLNGDGRCEGCGKTMYSPSGETDSCLCHGTGFRAFLYKIVLIIWKIFKINKTCVCGAKHYE